MGGILKSNKFIKNFLIHMELLTKKKNLNQMLAFDQIYSST